MDRDDTFNLPNTDLPTEDQNYGSVIKTPPAEPPRIDLPEQLTDPRPPGTLDIGDFR
jgi:hypothetical protein